MSDQPHAVRAPHRRLAPSTWRFARNADIEAVAVGQLEGMSGNSTDDLSVKVLVTGRDAGLMEFRRKKGRVDPRHSHPDHESICYLVSGRVRVVIEDQSFIAEPGDAWIHPPGVMHLHETLEDSVQIEVKAPPVRTWD
ncbi:MAG: cupin domain-containing protein [Pseudomonadota bacterium]